MNLSIQLPSAANDCTSEAVAKFAYKRVLTRLQLLLWKALDLWHNLMKFKSESEYFLNPSISEDNQEYTQFLHLLSSNRQLFNELCDEYGELSEQYQKWKVAFGASSPHLKMSLKQTLLQTYSFCALCREQIV